MDIMYPLKATQMELKCSFRIISLLIDENNNLKKLNDFF